MGDEPKLADYAAVQDYLFSLKAQGLKFGIDRMRLLAAAIGHPERTVPCVHIAGTNGKGSVAAMLDAILKETGLRRGLYTSPHLVRLGERVQVDRVLLGEGEIMAYAQDPSCVWFTLQDDLPAETVQIITYGAPEFSAYLAMSLSGDGEWKMVN